ncbi:MAG TPA: hypothetical protein PLH98_06035 [Ruminococcus flavefaciens]|nr:hypothetical protein [Ruminococcus flavefaciens]
MFKRIVSIGTSGLLAYCGFFPTLQVKAIENDFSYSDESLDRTAGLIDNYHNGISESGGQISFTAWTYSTYSMKSIGLKNISIERSSNGTSRTEEKTISDKLTSNSTSYSLSNYMISVNGGYHYRIKCDHYARNSSGTTQYVSSTSNSVWIS